MEQLTALRVGIDVGGTFTDAVAVDSATRAIVARVKVPTTHESAGGVADGIVEALRRLLAEPGVAADRIRFIAHSTTQATNALLEGDVAGVGVVALLEPPGFLSRAQIGFPPMRLGSSSLAPVFRFVNARDPGAQKRAVDELASLGVAAVVATAAFGVDRPALESPVVDYARERGLAATAGHEVASLYGLRARTRTAVLNASILPRMVQTSRMTAGAVERAGIDVPLMIMRSDGGVMDVREVARRPILTMLSGPAAGIAGALLHENVTDGIFIEVGGTSADLSVIRRGLPQLRTARIGEHRTMLRSLDVRTIAIAGGSLLRLTGGSGPAAVAGAGPRSAHIAGLGYAAFTPFEAFEGARVERGGEYLRIVLRDGASVGLTPTCAANALGLVPPGAFSLGDRRSAGRAFALAAEGLGLDGPSLARAMLERCAHTMRATIDALIAEYELDPAHVELVGGGGGAAALVPFVAEAMHVRCRIARDAEVISPIGVALALVRDVVERTIANPSPADILAVRREAVERVVASGADPALVEVAIELDGQRNVVRAIAQGGTAASAGAAGGEPADDPQRGEAAARALGAGPGGVEACAEAGSMRIYRAVLAPARGWRARLAPPGRWEDLCVVDRRGVVRLIARESVAREASVASIEAALAALLEETTTFGDVGRALPMVILAYGDRVAQLGALAEGGQVLALAREELSGLEPGVPVAIVAQRRKA